MTLTEQVTIGYGSVQPPAIHSLSGRQFMRTDVLGGSAVDVRSLGVRNGFTELAFTVPGSNNGSSSNTWYRIWIDRHYRLRRELLVGQEGRILRTFRYSRQAVAGG